MAEYHNDQAVSTRHWWISKPFNIAKHNGGDLSDLPIPITFRIAIEMLWKVQATSTLLFKNPCRKPALGSGYDRKHAINLTPTVVASSYCTEDIEVDPSDISSGVPSSFASSPPSVSSPDFDKVDPH